MKRKSKFIEFDILVTVAFILWVVLSNGNRIVNVIESLHDSDTHLFKEFRLHRRIPTEEFISANCQQRSGSISRVAL